MLLFALLLLLFSCGADEDDPDQNGPGAVAVAVSANMQFAFEELSTAFETETGIKVEATVASSGVLTAQISNGAPFDLFLSANMKYPDKLYGDSIAATAPEVYASGALILWSTGTDSLPTSLAGLSASAFEKIGVPDPEGAPYGKAAVAALHSAGMFDSIATKIIYGESVGQVNQYVHLGAVDIGFTAKSVVFRPQFKGEGKWVDVDPALYEPIKQGVVILEHGQNENLVNTERFYAFLFTDKAREILLDYGYRVN